MRFKVTPNSTTNRRCQVVGDPEPVFPKTVQELHASILAAFPDMQLQDHENHLIMEIPLPPDEIVRPGGEPLVLDSDERKLLWQNLCADSIRRNMNCDIERLDPAPVITLPEARLLEKRHRGLFRQLFGDRTVDDLFGNDA